MPALTHSSTAWTAAPARASSSHSSARWGTTAAASRSARALALSRMARASTASFTVAGICSLPAGQDFYDEERVAPGLLVQFSAVDAMRRRQLAYRVG